MAYLLEFLVGEACRHDGLVAGDPLASGADLVLDELDDGNGVNVPIHTRTNNNVL